MSPLRIFPPSVRFSCTHWPTLQHATAHGSHVGTRVTVSCPTQRRDAVEGILPTRHSTASSQVRMKCVYAASVLLACSVAEAVPCTAASNDVVMQSAAYMSCQKVTGIDFTSNRRGSLNAELFCGTADCRTLWYQLQQFGYLQCLDGYGGDECELRQEASAAECFHTYGQFNARVLEAEDDDDSDGEKENKRRETTKAPTPKPVTVPPVAGVSNGGGTSTSTPTIVTVSNNGGTPASSPTTVGSSNGGGTSASTPTVVGSSNSGGTSASTPTVASAPSTGSSTVSSSTSTTNFASTPSASKTPPSASTTTNAEEAGLSTRSTTLSTSKNQEELRSQEIDASGSGRREAKDEDAILAGQATVTNTNAVTRISESISVNGTGPAAPSTSSPENSTVPSGASSAGTKHGSSVLWIAMGGGVAVVVLTAIGLVFVRGPRLRPPTGMKPIDDLDSNLGYIATLHSSRSRGSSVSSHASHASISILESSAVATGVAVWDDEIIEAIRIPYEKLTIGTLLSRGGFGEVYKGMYRNKVVAIKSLLPERRQDMGQIRNFFVEIKLMAVLEHEHIVKLIGVAWDSLSELCVVSEFLSRGDLRALMVQYHAKESAHPKGFSQEKVKIAMHVAHALTYMHSLQPMVLHRDLKSRNILLDEELNAKITDFGVSRERVDSTMTIGVGSSLWMAPEVMTGGRYDDKADVFSFGVVLSELDTHTLPYSHAMEPGLRRRLPDTVVVQMMTTGRLTVEFTDDSPMAQLGRRCVALDPKARPSAAEVQHQIHQLLRVSSASA